MKWLIKSGQTLWYVIYGFPRIVSWCSRWVMNIEAVSFLWFSTVRVGYMTWIINFRVIWLSYSSINFDWFNFTQAIWNLSHIWFVNLSLIKVYSVMLMFIRNFKCKLKELLTTVPSASRGFQAQTLNEFWTKKTREILNDTLDFIAFSMKHEGFLNCSGYFLRNHYYYCCWNIVSQNLDGRADHQVRTQFP